MLSRDQILGAEDIKRELIKVPEWGGEVYVKVMSGDERDSFEQSCIANGKPSLIGSRARLAVRCMVDEMGKRLFADDDADELAQKSGAALQRVCKAAERLNKLNDRDLEELKGN